MDCTIPLTVGDWYRTHGKGMKLVCEQKIIMMNDMLNLMRADIYDFRVFKRIKNFAGDGEITFDVQEPIYYIDDWYARGSCPHSGRLIDLQDQDCEHCGGGYKQLMMYDVGAERDELDQCQFQYCFDGNILNANIPKGITEGFFEYYVGPKPIRSLDDNIPLPPSLMSGLMLLMRGYYLEKAGTMYQGDNTLYERRYAEYIQKQKDRFAKKMKYFYDSKML